MMVWNRLEQWQKIAILLLGLLGAGWSAHATVGPILDQVAANTKWIQIQDFSQLERTLCYRRLNGPEYNRFVYLGRTLGYFPPVTPNVVGAPLICRKR